MGQGQNSTGLFVAEMIDPVGSGADSTEMNGGLGKVCGCFRAWSIGHLALCASLLLWAGVVPALARRQSSTTQAESGKQETAPSTTHTATNSAAKTPSTTHHATATAAHSPGAASHSAKTTHTAARRHSSKRKSKSARARGQQKIDSERATSIQEALIREHYLSGEPSGVWDAESEAAMRRYQGDHGWQTKEVPDSRALIKLGLGPNNDHLLNPESAMTSTPIARQSDPPAAASHTPTSAQPASKAGSAPPSGNPAATPQTVPTATPQTAPANPAVPATPPKDSDGSASPQ